jgi:hypothetical protein
MRSRVRQVIASAVGHVGCLDGSAAGGDAEWRKRAGFLGGHTASLLDLVSRLHRTKSFQGQVPVFWELIDPKNVGSIV